MSSHSCFSGSSDFGVGRTSFDVRKMMGRKVLNHMERII